MTQSNLLPTYEGKVQLSRVFSRDNCKTSTPKIMYILNQHDRGNVLGHFLSGLGSGVGCRNGFVNRGIKEVLITKKQAQLTVPVPFLRVQFLTPLQVRGRATPGTSATLNIYVCDCECPRVNPPNSRAKSDESMWQPWLEKPPRELGS